MQIQSIYTYILMDFINVYVDQRKISEFPGYTHYTKSQKRTLNDLNYL